MAGQLIKTLTGYLSNGRFKIVSQFLKDEISYTDIAQKLKKIITKHQSVANPSLKEILEIKQKIADRVNDSKKQENPSPE